MHSAPEKDSCIFDIRNSLNTLCLILTFHISLGISAPKTAFILKISSLALVLIKLALTTPSPLLIIAITLIALIPLRRKSPNITAYHIDNTRNTLSVTIAMNEPTRTSKPEQEVTLVTDGNPSYPAGIHFINQSRDSKLTHKKVLAFRTWIQNQKSSDHLNSSLNSLIAFTNSLPRPLVDSKTKMVPSLLLLSSLLITTSLNPIPLLITNRLFK